MSADHAHSDVHAKGTKREYYHNLDLMRGFAALYVVLIHVAGRLDLTHLATHAYLGVDFFFALSGFVMCSAYQNDLERRALSTKQFILLRLIRIFPLIFLGTLISALLELGRPGVTDQAGHLYRVSIAFLAGILALPLPLQPGLEQTAFPLNLPVWSIFFEFIADLLFAAWVGLARRSLLLLSSMAVSLFFILHGASVFDHLNRGFYISDLWFGLARSVWSFSAGILAYKFRRYAPSAGVFLPCVLFSIMALNPFVPSFNNTLDVLSILVFIPFILFIAINTKTGRTGVFIARWSGNLSFPIYALHYPFTRIVSVLDRNFAFLSENKALTVALFLPTMLILAFLAHVLYDLPVRKKLLSLYSRP